MLAACVLVNATCMTSSSLSKWCERSLSAISQMILSGVVSCVHTTSHHDNIITDLDGTVAVSMSHCERSLMGSWTVHGDPFGGAVWIVNGSDEKDSVLRCCTAVVFPLDCCVLQMLPGSLSVDLTSVEIASNKATRDEVHRWAKPHPPWIVIEDAAPLLWISSRPNLNRLSCSTINASYDQDPCKAYFGLLYYFIIITITITKCSKNLNFENSINFLNALDQYKLKFENAPWPYIAPSLRTCATLDMWHTRRNER